MPSAPYWQRQEAALEDDRALGLLRARLAVLPPRGAEAREGWTLLAEAERRRGGRAAAAEAYGQALAIRFEPEMAAQLGQVLLADGRTEAAVAMLADALPRAPQHIGLRFLTGLAAERDGRPDAARAAWQALVADAPAEAPWRAMVEKRLGALP
jgi:cytochrome c-type biogenesis protein CcmH